MKAPPLKTLLFLAFFALLLPRYSAAQFETATQFRQDIIRFAPIGVLADTVKVWSVPGGRARYLLPRGTTVTELLSYPGVGPNMRTAGIRGSEGTGVLGYLVRPQIEIYLNRYDPDKGEETLEHWRYRVREPFPEGMRNYPLRNGEYVTIYVRTRPTTLQYVFFGISTLGTLIGGYYLIDRVF